MTPAQDRKVTLVDIAREASCSVSLASIVMRDAAGASEESRRRIKAVANRLGYRPDQRARSLRSARSGLIGVTFGVHQPFHGELVEGLYAAAESTDHGLVLSAVVGGIDDRRAAEPLLRNRCEALIMIAPSLGTARLRILADEVPIVTVARPIASTDVDVIRADDAGGIALAVDHLVGLGHARITHLDGGTAPSSAERREGYRESMEAHGLGGHVHVVHGGIEHEDGIRAVEEMLAAGTAPTAVVAFNDRLAIGAIQALRLAGLSVPGDVSVVGYDNSRRSDSAIVPLTTIDQNAGLMADLALKRAVGRAARELLPGKQILIPRLVERASTAPPRSREHLAPESEQPASRGGSTGAAPGAADSLSQ